MKMIVVSGRDPRGAPYGRVVPDRDRDLRAHLRLVFRVYAARSHLHHSDDGLGSLLA